MRLLGLASALAACMACGPEPASGSASGSDSGADCDPWMQACLVTLRDAERLELATAAVSAIDSEAELEQDGYVGASGTDVLVLSVAPGAQFCAHTTSFSSVSAVPDEPCPSDCRGMYAPCKLSSVIFEDGQDDAYADFGFLVTTEDDDRYRTRVLSADATEVTLEYMAVR